MIQTPRRHCCLLVVAIQMAFSAPFLLKAQEHLPGPSASRAEWPEAIEDNSFLIEEAYNQEPGVVQYIFSYLRTRPDGAWAFTFTNEWPVPDETNQLSYAVSEVRSGTGNPSGLGDTFLNYRRQLLWEERDGWAFAPRLSVILPTGDWRKNLGNGVTGWQVGLPFSRRISPSFATHFNFVATYYPQAKSITDSGLEARNSLKAWSEGASLVWLTTPRLNVLVELVATQLEQPDGKGGVERLNQALINPGLRYAFNLPKGQLVLGASLPIGLTPDSPHSGVFLYLSWEAPAWKPSRSK
jgi:hypothetical protein